ncbi:LAFA_0E01508g1_1 [Lachancea sp. 'fantastica']|nr:LAFA_0E01508g1_1 [Lachancea sp. 'fantastica']
MASTSHNPAILLRRVLSLRENSHFVLVIDSIGRSGHCVLDEVAHEAEGSTTIIYVSFETIRKPNYATHFIDGCISPSRLLTTIQSFLPSPEHSKLSAGSKFLVVIDSINSIPGGNLVQFVTQLASPSVALLAIFHKDVPEYRSAELENYPSSIQLLKFMASSIIEVRPFTLDIGEEQDQESGLQKLDMPTGLNSSVYKLILTNRRKSGRALTHEFKCDSQTHSFTPIQNDEDSTGDPEGSESFEGLTTFNLGTSNRQKAAKEQVALPFLEAQTFNTGGAIVYEFEKDDDYDEEDPYEDPF